MSRRQLTAQWSIELDDGFAARVIDGDVQLVSIGPPVRTMWVSVWSPPSSLSPNEVVATIRQEMNPEPTLRFEEPGASVDELRVGSWYPETVDGRTQWGLYAYTVRSGSYVQAAFLSDDEADLDWALAAWRSLRSS